MKYKQEYLKLQKQLAEESKERQKYERWWQESEEKLDKSIDDYKDLEDKIKDLETSKLKLEVDLLRKVVSLHEKQPPASEVNYIQVPNSNGVTTSSSTTII
jgi:septal ring factor EnvC (AmiA/AmiB activator)